MSVISTGLRWKKGTGQRMWSDRRCYENSHKDFWGIKGLVILRKIKGNILLWDKGPKQDRQFQPEPRVKWAQSDAMGMDWASCAVREIKRKLIWRQQQLQHCSTGQRHFLPSSVIICMLVPLLLSWLNEITGSFLPGFANGARQVLGRNGYWSMSRDNKHKNSTIHTVIHVLKVSNLKKLCSQINHNYLTEREKHATVVYQPSEPNIKRQSYLAPLWWGYLLRLWQKSAELIRGLGCFQEKIYPFRVVWSLNGHTTRDLNILHSIGGYKQTYQQN